jgi:hypothetical protein
MDRTARLFARSRRAATPLILVLGIGATAFADPPPPRFGQFPGAVEDMGMRPAPIQLAREAEARAAGRPVGAGLAQIQLYPGYIWPLVNRPNDTTHVVNYVDEDPTTGIRDYMNGAWTYDTHRGTDFSILDFRTMDKGMRIRSAAAGTCTYVVYANLRDRNCAVPDNPTLNYIEIANGDGTYTYYYHLRANSATVSVGEAVQPGTVLGLAGSSGYSFGPHLHFEPADYNAGYEWRDPWAGPANPQPGLWNVQEPWDGVQHLRVFDMGVTTQTAAGGNLASIDYCAFVEEHLQQPAVFGIHEPYLPIWLYPQGLAGDAYHLEIRRPDNSVWGSVDYTAPGDIQGGYQYWYWNWDGNVSSADYGTWTVRLLIGGNPVRAVSFVVGPSTVFGPRFAPKVGRSFRVNGSAQKDTLRVTGLSPGVTYSLINGSSFATLADSIVTIAASSSQSTRSYWFDAIATDGAGRRDTAYFHVVDPTKPQEALLAVDPPAADARLALAGAAPNPFTRATTIRFTAPPGDPVRLTIHDLAGRRVRTLVNGRGTGEPRTATWDGRDDAGRVLSAGVYFCRLVAGAGQTARRIVLLP